MIDTIFGYLGSVEGFFWSYIAFVIILLLGLSLSLQGRLFQIRAFPTVLRTFVAFMTRKSGDVRGIHPLKVFFASVGGMIGVGNVVGIATAVQLGGPGALFWVWVAALVGSIIKYAEIYLGLKHRVQNSQGGYDGGPMYFLKRAFNNRWVPVMVALLLCVYGVEIYQFTVVTETLTSNFSIDRYLVIGALLFLVLYSSIGGIDRIGKICSFVMPFFMTIYLSMGFWIVFKEFALLPGIIKTVFTSAFTGHAAIGGFAGSSVLLALQHGIARASYSADIGIGYDSIIQSESNTVYPEKQAQLGVIGVFFDNMICTMSMLIVLISGVWKSVDPIEGSQLVQVALSKYFPYMNVFMPLFLLIVGYTTMIVVFCVGIKCAKYLHPTRGMQLYIAYGFVTLILFSFFDQTKAQIVMSIAQSILLVTNLLGIYVLRRELVFVEEEEPEQEDEALLEAS